MSELTPLVSLYEEDCGVDVPLPPALAALYGRLRLPLHPGHPYIIGNFVSTLDGVVSLNAPGQAGGGEISGFNVHDRMVMGLLRAVSDAVIVGAGTLRAEPSHLWTAAYIFPPLAEAYQALRTAVGKPEPPLNVIVTARGAIDFNLPLFRTGAVPVLIVTTPEGRQHMRDCDLPPSVQVVVVPGAASVSARAILDAVNDIRASEVILVEGGPRLMGDFFAEQCLHEQFLTLAPQIAGRDGPPERPGLVAGHSFAPEHALWGTLTAVKRGGSHLFLRYAFASAA
jgi:riboflavin biosynthesis pyrimidine reductase